MVLKLYNLPDSPPCLVVRICLKYLGKDCELAQVDFLSGQQFSKPYLEKNPQGEVPCINDDGFYLSESVAILQYLADKYKKDDTFYPIDIKNRALVNHRLAFNLSSYYKSFLDYIVYPLYYAMPQTQNNKVILEEAMKAFDNILDRQFKKGFKYAAGESVTIADCSLFMTTACLDITYHHSLKKNRNITIWYNYMKEAHPDDFWYFGKICQKELKKLIKNPPDLSHLVHPKFPTDKSVLKEEEKFKPAVDQ